MVVAIAGVITVILVLITIAIIAKKGSKKGKSGNRVLFKTDMGDFEVGLYSSKAPISAKNFLNYVEKGFYAGTIFHRVMPGFMLQGGGFTDKMVLKKTLPPIRNEASNGIKNTRCTLSMARTKDPHSANSQFFVNVVDNKSLDPGFDKPGYAVFAKITKGMDVIDEIAKVATKNHGNHANVPVKPIHIISAKIL
ncbi:MAG: peptidylprolyl isomerase [Pseudomonadales bacterium]|nr:peptidylprolyl isomerase [Pseudomonadales bacterium]